MRRSIYSGILVGLLIFPLAGRAAELDVFPAGQQPRLYDYLLGQFAEQDARRTEAVAEALWSPAAMRKRQEQLLADYHDLVGPLPDRTALNARTVGTIDCDGYRIERVIYESRPGHHVTASLYLPDDTSKPLPGVLVPCGHSANGKASEAYQSASILLALNGCVALIYDPIGQGERHQLTGVGHGTNEHTLVGIGALLVGLNTAHYRIYDGLRSMDYLASRPEVDPARLGCSGNSGGGTMTTWLMAFDERIAVAAPSCFVTTLERLFHTIGPQDCEQHFPGQGPRGIDHTDFITMRATKPTLILAAEQDFFDFGGTREAARQAEAVYRLLGKPEQVGLFSYNDKHGFSQPRRQAAVHWMRRWLADDDRPVQEPTLTLQSDAALQVTEAGQVLEEFEDEQTVVDFTKARASQLAKERGSAWESMNGKQRQDTIREVLGLPTEPELGCTAATVGTLERDGLAIEKLRLEREGEMPLAALLCSPADSKGKRPLVIYADPAGKAAALESGAIERYLSDGFLVLAVDLRGYGETAEEKDAKYQNDAFRTSMLAMHVGRPLVGQRVEDLLTALEFAQGQEAVDAKDIRLVGVGNAGPVALHAAALDDRFASVAAIDSIDSWEDDVVCRPGDSQLLELAVPGALEHYDLPDLVAMLGDRVQAESAAAKSSP